VGIPVLHQQVDILVTPVFLGTLATLAYLVTVVIQVSVGIPDTAEVAYLDIAVTQELHRLQVTVDTLARQGIADTQGLAGTADTPG
jgi:5-bromo-4-chloroindolyl phosphate hydrolysis protein